mmetsp:Transcript_1139/g.1988  ORF Transcript_1139/g.1988 Transcript_1139/m.1988 type:complete len:118 (-) Transcript_1139:1537-1890(-)
MHSAQRGCSRGGSYVSRGGGRGEVEVGWGWGLPGTAAGVTTPPLPRRYDDGHHLHGGSLGRAPTPAGAEVKAMAGTGTMSTTAGDTMTKATTEDAAALAVALLAPVTMLYNEIGDIE